MFSTSRIALPSILLTHFSAGEVTQQTEIMGSYCVEVRNHEAPKYIYLPIGLP